LPAQSPTPENESCRRISAQLKHLWATPIRVKQQAPRADIRAAKHHRTSLRRPIQPNAGKHRGAPFVMTINARALQLQPNLGRDFVPPDHFGHRLSFRQHQAPMDLCLLNDLLESSRI
jgi:hypothetical protein